MGQLSTKRSRKTATSIEAAQLSHVPAVFLMLHGAAQEGFFSSWLFQPRTQYRLLLMLISVVLFGRAFPAVREKHSARLRVAIHDGVVIGHTILLSYAKRMEIFTCAVRSDFRRTGVGRMLVGDAVNLAGELSIHAACMPKSHGMCMLLRKAGFVEEGRFLPGKWANVVLRHWQRGNAQLEKLSA